MPTATAPQPVSLRVKLSLPEDILARYEDRARKMSMGLEALMARRLVETIDQTSQRPIYLNDSERQTLESQLGHNLGTGRQLVDAVGKLARIKTGPASINLSETLLSRLRSRCPRNENFEGFLERNMVALLEQFVGLR